MTPAELTSARKALGLTQEALAIAIGVSGGRTVRKWEAGDRAIPQSVAKLVAILVKKRKPKEGKRGL